MYLLFFILGVIATLIIAGVIKLNQSSRIGWAAWILGGIGIILLLFSIAWSVSSVIEAEPRAASMGMVFFGVLALIFIALGLRLKKKQK